MIEFDVTDDADRAFLDELTRFASRSEAATFTIQNGLKHQLFRHHVQRGDAERDARQWPEAFRFYRLGLDILPLHGGYLVQAGHCLKELNMLGAAEGYYRSALLCACEWEDVAEHLVFISGRNRHLETVRGLRLLSKEVRDGRAHVALRPTFDDLQVLAAMFGGPGKATIEQLLGWMRKGSSYPDIVAAMVDMWGAPRALMIPSADFADPLGIDPLVRRTTTGTQARGIGSMQLGEPARRRNWLSVFAQSLSRGTRQPTDEFHLGAIDMVHSPDAASVGSPSINGRRARNPRTWQLPAKQVALPAHTPTTSYTRLVADAHELAVRVLKPGAESVARAFFAETLLRVDGNNVSRTEAGAPKLSVLILNRDKAALTLLSVLSVLSAGISVPYEVIVVDNASSAAERAILKGSDLAFRLAELDVHRSFAEANNIGADLALGDTLLFLNNDAFLASGSVDTMLTVLAGTADASAVGPCLIAPDGVLLEAGGFIDADGQAVRAGRFDESLDATQFSGSDVVDYVSGACLMTPAATFARAGGFSTHYEPAYYEDADLCLKLRRLGGVVLLAGQARCFHLENVTSRAEGMPDPDQYAGYNGRAFRGRWGKFVATRAPSLAARAVADCPEILSPKNCQPAHLALVSPALAAGDEARLVLGALAASGAKVPSAITSDQVISSARLRQWAADSEIAVPAAGWLDPTTLAGGKLDSLLLAGPGLFPPAQGALANAGVSTRCFLAYRPEPQAASKDALAWLQSCSKVIVPSVFAQRTYLELLRGAARTSVKTEVLRLPFTPAAAPATKRGPIVLSAGRFGDPAHHLATRMLLDGFAASEMAGERKAELVLAGGFGVGEHGASGSEADAEAIEEAAAERGIRVRLVVGSDAASLRLLSESARYYVEAQGLGAPKAEVWRCDMFGYRAGLAMSEGCILLAYKIGAAADLAVEYGGRRFANGDELAGLLRRN